MKKSNRALSLVLVVLMLISMVSVFVLPASAATYGTDEWYEDVLESAYIVYPSYVQGETTTIFFGGKDRALPAGQAVYADIAAAVTAATGVANPVFVIAPGTYNTATNMPAGSTLYGAYAGVSPNAALTDADKTIEGIEQNGGWKSNTARTDSNETKISKLAFTGSVEDSASYVVDGFTVNGQNDDKATRDSSATKATVDSYIYFDNCKITYQYPVVATTATNILTHVVVRDSYVSNSSNQFGNRINYFAFERSFLKGLGNALNNAAQKAVEGPVSLSISECILYNWGTNALIDTGAAAGISDMTAFDLTLKDNIMHLGKAQPIVIRDNRYPDKNLVHTIEITGNLIYDEVSADSIISLNCNDDKLDVTINDNRIVATQQDVKVIGNAGTAFTATQFENGTVSINANNNFFSTATDAAGKEVVLSVAEGAEDCVDWDYYSDYAMTTLVHKLIDVEGAEATCKADGYTAHKACKNCDYVEGKETISSAGIDHNPGQAVEENHDPATCLKDATYDSVVYCTVCNEEISRDTINVENTKLSHIWGEYTYNEDATCKADGTKTADCTNGCGEKDTITAENTKISHSWGEYVYNGDATEEADGTKTADCIYGCGEKNTITAEGTKIDKDVVDFNTVLSNEKTYIVDNKYVDTKPTTIFLAGEQRAIPANKEVYKTMADAVAAANGVANPIFVVAPSDTAYQDVSVPAGSTIYGAYAGITPNDPDFDKTLENVIENEGVWTKNPARSGTETLFDGTFTVTGVLTSDSYVVIDGITHNSKFATATTTTKASVNFEFRVNNVITGFNSNSEWLVPAKQVEANKIYYSYFFTNHRNEKKIGDLGNGNFVNVTFKDSYIAAIGEYALNNAYGGQGSDADNDLNAKLENVIVEFDGSVLSNWNGFVLHNSGGSKDANRGKGPWVRNYTLSFKNNVMYNMGIKDNQGVFSFKNRTTNWANSTMGTPNPSQTISFVNNDIYYDALMTAATTNNTFFRYDGSSVNMKAVVKDNRIIIETEKAIAMLPDNPTASKLDIVYSGNYFATSYGKDVVGTSGAFNEGKVPAASDDWTEFNPTCIHYYTDYDMTTMNSGDYQAVVTQPSCEAGGYTTYTCNNCGYTFVGDYTPESHLFENYQDYEPATCRDNATKIAYCEYGCGESDIKEIDGTRTPHKFVTFIYNNDATCHADGTESAACVNGCGVAHTRSVAGTKLTHKWGEYVYNNDATATADGTKTAECIHGCGETDTVTAEGTKTASKVDFDKLLKDDKTFIISSSSEKVFLAGKERDIPEGKAVYQFVEDAVTAANGVENPVFVIGSGNHGTINIPAGSSVYGAYAGVSPNKVDFDKTLLNVHNNIKSGKEGWEATKDRYASKETKLAGIIVSGELSSDSTVVIDGVTNSGSIKTITTAADGISSVNVDVTIDNVISTYVDGAAWLVPVERVEGKVVYTSFNFNNFRANATISDFGNGHIANLYFKDSFIPNIPSYALQNGINKGNASNGKFDNVTVEFEGCVLYNWQGFIMHLNNTRFNANTVENFNLNFKNNVLYKFGDGSTQGPFSLKNRESGYTVNFNFIDNDIYTTCCATEEGADGSNTYFMVDNNNIKPMTTLVFTGNRMVWETANEEVSVLPDMNIPGDKAYSACNLNFNNNYFAKTLGETVVGKPIEYREGHAPTVEGSWPDWSPETQNYYLDYAMTKSYAGVFVTDVKLDDCSKVTVDGNTINLLATSGLLKADSLVTVSEAANVEIYSNSTYSAPVDEIDISTIDTTATYYVKTYFEGTATSATYTLVITIDESVHNIKYVAQKEADCDEIGWSSHSACKNDGCSYKVGYVEYDMLGHDWTDPEDYSQASCTANAMTYQECKREDCGEIRLEDKEGTKLSHKHETYTENTPASCTKNATEISYCEYGCGTSNVRDVENSQLAHKYETYVEGEKATCKKNATEISYCEYGCNTKDEREILGTKLSHKWGTYTYNNDATCVKDGTKTASCSYGCGTTDTKTADGTMLEHKWGKYTYNNDATCVKDGTKTASCSYGCGTTNTVKDADHKASRTPHTWGKYTYNGDATCAKDGTKTAKCKVDGCTATDTVKDKNHLKSTVAHTWGEYVFDDNATPASDATETAKCKAKGCDATDSRVVPGTKLPPLDTSKVFEDVNKGDWYKDAVDYCYSNGFIAGMSETVFGVNTKVSRAMFVTIIARMAGVDTSEKANAKATTKFADVKAGQWYSAAVKWANEKGIVSGISETSFAPNANLTREQLCVMVVNFAKVSGTELTATKKEIKFADSNKIASWAKDAVKVCQRAGIVSGYVEGSKTYFKPQNTATRAEATQILYVLHKNFIAK